MSATVFFADVSNEIATLTNVFKVNGVPTDATTATVTVTDPTGATSTPSVTHVTTGTYSATVACTLDGIWAYKWTGTGTATDVQEGSFTVGPSDLTRNYCTAEELKSRLAITGTADDSEIMLAVAGASRAIDGYCERYFFRATDTRTYIPTDLYLTRIDDIVSVTTLATDPAGTAPQGGTYPVTWAASDFQLLPYNPGKTGEQWPYTSIRAVGTKTFPWVVPVVLMRQDRVQVTGIFGWPAIPQAVRSAALIMAADLFKLKDAPFGVAGFGEFGVIQVDSNPRASALLGPYVLHPVQAA